MPAVAPDPAPAGAAAAERENGRLRRLVAAYSHLSALVAHDATVSDVLALVAGHTGADVALLDRALAVIADAGEGGAGAAVDQLRVTAGTAPLGRVLGATARARRPVQLPAEGRSVIVAPVVIGDDVSAYLVTAAPTDPDAAAGDTDLLLTEYAGTLCGIVLGRERVVAAAAGRARLDLVEGLLLARGRERDEADGWARHLGFVPGRPHHVLAAVPAAGSDGDPATALAAVEHRIERRAPQAIVAVRGAEVVAIVPVVQGLAQARELGEDCLAAVGRGTRHRLVVGVGGSCAQPADIARSYAEARSAVDTALRIARSGVVAFEDLGVRRVLLQVPDLGALRGFAADVLGPLAAPQDPQHGELATTLATFLEATGSPQRTAQALHVHPNTVANRIRRVEELTGLRMDSGRDRLVAHVAIEIVQAVGDAP